MTAVARSAGAAVPPAPLEGAELNTSTVAAEGSSCDWPQGAMDTGEEGDEEQRLRPRTLEDDLLLLREVFRQRPYAAPTSRDRVSLWGDVAHALRTRDSIAITSKICHDRFLFLVDQLQVSGSKAKGKIVHLGGEAMELLRRTSAAFARYRKRDKDQSTGADESIAKQQEEVPPRQQSPAARSTAQSTEIVPAMAVTKSKVGVTGRQVVRAAIAAALQATQQPAGARTNMARQASVPLDAESTSPDKASSGDATMLPLAAAFRSIVAGDNVGVPETAVKFSATDDNLLLLAVARLRPYSGDDVEQTAKWGSIALRLSSSSHTSEPIKGEACRLRCLHLLRDFDEHGDAADTTMTPSEADKNRIMLLKIIRKDILREVEVLNHQATAQAPSANATEQLSTATPAPTTSFQGTAPPQVQIPAPTAAVPGHDAGDDGNPTPENRRPESDKKVTPRTRVRAAAVNAELKVKRAIETDLAGSDYDNKDDDDEDAEEGEEDDDDDDEHIDDMMESDIDFGSDSEPANDDDDDDDEMLISLVKKRARMKASQSKSKRKQSSKSRKSSRRTSSRKTPLRQQKLQLQQQDPQLPAGQQQSPADPPLPPIATESPQAPALQQSVVAAAQISFERPQPLSSVAITKKSSLDAADRSSPTQSSDQTSLSTHQPPSSHVDSVTSPTPPAQDLSGVSPCQETTSHEKKRPRSTCERSEPFDADNGVDVASDEDVDSRDSGQADKKARSETVTHPAVVVEQNPQTAKSSTVQPSAEPGKHANPLTFEGVFERLVQLECARLNEVRSQREMMHKQALLDRQRHDRDRETHDAALKAILDTVAKERDDRKAEIFGMIELLNRERQERRREFVAMMNLVTKAMAGAPQPLSDDERGADM